MGLILVSRYYFNHKVRNIRLLLKNRSFIYIELSFINGRKEDDQ